jgi:hypothetical protein
MKRYQEEHALFIKQINDMRANSSSTSEFSNQLKQSDKDFLSSKEMNHDFHSKNKIELTPSKFKPLRKDPNQSTDKKRGRPSLADSSCLSTMAGTPLKSGKIYSHYA